MWRSSLLSNKENVVQKSGGAEPLPKLSLDLSLTRPAVLVNSQLRMLVLDLLQYFVTIGAQVSRTRPFIDELGLSSSFHEKLYNRGSGHTTPVAPADPLRHRAFLTSAPAAGAPLDAR